MGPDLLEITVYGFLGIAALIGVYFLVIAPIQNANIIKQAEAEAKLDSQRRKARVEEKSTAR